MLLTHKDPKKKKLQIVEICLLLILLPVGLYLGNQTYQDWQKFQEAELLYQEAAYLIDAGQVSKAIPLLEEAVSLYPVYPAAWETLGSMYYLKKDLAAETDAYEKAVKFNPDNGNLHRELGAAYHRSGKHDQELTVLLKAEKLGTNDEVFLESLIARANRESREDNSSPDAEPEKSPTDER